MTNIDYSKIDPNMRDLVKIINSFDGLTTISSCGGHPEPLTEGQWPENSWIVMFKVASNDNGWLAFQFLAELISDDRVSGVFLASKAAAVPCLKQNSPEMKLPFAYVGNYCCDPQELAKFIKEVKREYYKTKGNGKYKPDLQIELNAIN
jgi:hypothetical protein